MSNYMKKYGFGLGLYMNRGGVFKIFLPISNRENISVHLLLLN